MLYVELRGRRSISLENTDACHQCIIFVASERINLSIKTLDLVLQKHKVEYLTIVSYILIVDLA